MVAGRLVAHSAGLAALLGGLVAPAFAQPAPGPKPGPSAQSGSGAAATAGLDRREFPFHPLQTAWTANIGLQPSAPAATDGVRVFIPFTSGEMHVFSLAAGGLVFSRPVVSTLAPVVDDGRVFVTGTPFVEAMRSADGSPLWKTPLAAKAAFAPVARGGWVFVPLADGTLTALRADTGAAVWTVPAGATSAPPAIEGDRLYAATTGGSLQALTVTTGATVWRATVDSDATALAAVAGHVFVATSGRWLYALDAAKGHVRWRFRIQGTAIGLTVDEDRIVAVMLDQSIRAFKIGSGAQAWRQELSFRPAGGPIIAGRSVLVTGFAPSVRVIDRKTGANQGLYSLPLPIDAGGISLETLVTGPLLAPGATLFDDVVVLLTQHGFIHAARRAFDPPASPISVLPGTALALPAPPPGMPAETAPATPAQTTPTTTPTATSPATTPTTPPAAPTPPSVPPAPGPPAGTPPRTPPAPPAR